MKKTMFIFALLMYSYMLQAQVYKTYQRVFYKDLPKEIQLIMKQCKCGEIGVDPTQYNDYKTNYDEGFAIDLNNDKILEYAFCCEAPMHGPGNGKIYSLIGGKWKIIFDNYPIFEGCKPSEAINVLQTKSENYYDLILYNVKYKFIRGKYTSVK